MKHVLGFLQIVAILAIYAGLLGLMYLSEQIESLGWIEAA
jgi:hypothetical protein